MPLPLIYSAAATISSDDFGVEVDAERVVVPKEVGVALGKLRLSVRNADQLVNVLYMVPNELAAHLGWSVATFVHAREGLISQLDGRVADALLHPSAAVAFPLGARKPSALIN